MHCELEGPSEAVDAAIAALRDRPPPMARIDSVDITAVAPQGTRGFAIVASHDDDGSRTLVPPDIAVCADCLREMRDPADRRHGHPFHHLHQLPDPATPSSPTCPMTGPPPRWPGFPDVVAPALPEYRDPLDRRYHAQTIACSGCGPG